MKGSTFASNLKFLRRLNNLTQTQLAFALDIKRNRISSYESGFAEPNIKLLLDIANYFNLTTDKLVKQNLENDKANIAIYNVDKEEVMKQSLALIVKDYLHATLEAQKIFDGIAAYKNLKGRKHSDDQSMKEDRLFEVLKIMLANNWELIGEFQNSDN